ncbi:hypothetical protein [Brevundimonas sp. NIBR11]|uniref:hypothetical protein n=1 Tax=Brevundimonas sp. NIBR11 TaxID=3015999 RepID=UPI0022F11EFE|nr:hypothetical protein [Brevundimonas sp. NIBR11]WGM32304.1 hypothetical protein KKHFBJBL_02555 [Brevundimonas sp. NIBR11]
MARKHGALLEEPKVDNDRLVLDQALIDALTDRLAAGAETSPDASALALRALLAESYDAHQSAMLRSLWGRIEARTGAPLVVAGPAAQLLAADRFGLSAKAVADPDAALAQTAKGARALIDVANGRPWWGKLLARPDLRVIAALPDDRNGVPSTLMIAAQPTGPTGDDRTFWVTDSCLSDARIVEALASCGFVGQPLASASGLKLFMLAGYVQAEDGRLSSAPGSLSGVIGSAPLF